MSPLVGSAPQRRIQGHGAGRRGGWGAGQLRDPGFFWGEGNVWELGVAGGLSAACEVYGVSGKQGFSKALS